MSGRTYNAGEHISKHLMNKKFTLQPRFTVIHHPIREKFGLSFSEYAVIDSVHQLSHRPEHPWCTTSKEQIANFLSITRKTVHVALVKGIESGLLNKNERGDLRTTNKWIDNVVLYDNKKD